MSGALVIRCQLHGLWPPCKGSQILSHSDGESRIVIAAEEAGRLWASVTTTSGVYETVTVPVDLRGDGVVAWRVSWDDEGNVIILINGKTVPSAADEGAENFTITVESDDFQESAIGHPDADDTCQYWTTWRSKRFGMVVDPPSAYLRTKTLPEQIEELRDSVAELNAQLNQDAPPTRFSIIAGILRALLYWNGKNYEPLLLRLAARSNPSLALPVFAWPDLSPSEDSVLKRARMYGRFKTSMIRRIAGQRLMDIQGALLIPIQVEQFEPNEAAKLGRPSAKLDAKDLIRGVASDSGVSHYDEFARIELDWYRQLSVGGSPALGQILYEFAVVTRELALMVLDALESQDV